MLPCFSSNNVTDTVARNPIDRRDGHQCHAVFTHLSNHWYVRFGQLGGMALFAARAIVAFLVAHISYIISTSTEKEMIRVAARRIIALVKNTHSTRNRSIVQFVTESVCLVLLHTIVQLPVARRCFSALPFPARIFVANYAMTPEFICQRFKLSLSMSRKKSYGHTLNVAMLRFIFGRNPGLLPASTLAVAVGYFIRGFVRGMIAHVWFSLQNLTMPRDCFSSRRGAFIGVLQV
jgi:hypothetical protein